MEFRIGINLGDVIEEGDTIYGDGVNVAARLEGLAEGGGVCISGTAFDHVKNKISVGYEYQGNRSVKNIPDPVRVYKVLLEPEAAGKAVSEKEPGPKKKRWLVIAAAVVLIAGGLRVNLEFLSTAGYRACFAGEYGVPAAGQAFHRCAAFCQHERVPKQKYIADGLSENIISTLSTIPDMFVIARNSVFTYKGKPVKVQQVSEELGVKHVLEGSVQKSGNRLRITVQLIDALTGLHLWSERYDRDMQDLFDLQDEITKEIAVALQVKLTEGEQARLRHRTTNNLQAWGYANQGYSLFEHYAKEDNAKARELFEKALELDPDYAWACTWLAWTHWVDGRYGFSDSSTESFKQAAATAQKAVALDDSVPDVHALLGTISLSAAV